jgi:septal ring factor EnvC (AmiA/AmiB activator)
MKRQMKKARDKKDIIYFGWLVLLSVIAICGLIFSLADIDCKALDFSANKLGSIIGTWVSAIAIVITAYFVILAIDAYAYIQDLRKGKEMLEEWNKKYEKASNEIEEWSKKRKKAEQKIQQAETTIEKKGTDFNKTLRREAEKTSQILYEILNEQIAFVEELKINVNDINNANDTNSTNK